MSFFKDFKDDLSQAVNELMPENGEQPVQPQMVDTITPAAVPEAPKAEEDELASLLAALDMDVVNEEANKAEEAAAAPVDIPVYTETVMPASEAPTVEPIFASAPVAEEAPKTPVAPIFAPEPAAEEVPKVPVAPVFAPEPVAVEAPKAPVAPVFAPEPVVEEAPKAPVTPVFAPESEENRPAPINTTAASYTSVGCIPEGMTVVGDITSEGSLDIMGIVKGNITIAGKLNVTGMIEGNSKADEVFADGAKIVGEIASASSIKVGQSSVIKGNVTAASAVLAGAIKGDIDVKGPVVLDSTAIIMGNIKSKSIQINNGAAIEGLCSQCYAEVSPVSFFTED